MCWCPCTGQLEGGSSGAGSMESWREAALVLGAALQSPWKAGGMCSQRCGDGAAVAMVALQGPKEHIPRP